MGILTWILVTQLADGSIVQSFQRAAQKVTVIAGWQKPQNKAGRRRVTSRRKKRHAGQRWEDCIFLGKSGNGTHCGPKPPAHLSS